MNVLGRDVRIILSKFLTTSGVAFTYTDNVRVQFMDIVPITLVISQWILSSSADFGLTISSATWLEIVYDDIQMKI